MGSCFFDHDTNVHPFAVVSSSISFTGSWPCRTAWKDASAYKGGFLASIGIDIGEDSLCSMCIMTFLKFFFYYWVED